MKNKLIKLIKQVQDSSSDRFNADSYFNTSARTKEGMLISQYVLGNLFAKGYCNDTKQNFEIYKDHSTYQIWVWSFESSKSEYNQFSTAQSQYEKVIDFIQKTF